MLHKNSTYYVMFFKLKYLMYVLIAGNTSEHMENFFKKFVSFLLYFVYTWCHFLLVFFSLCHECRLSPNLTVYCLNNMFTLSICMLTSQSYTGMELISLCQKCFYSQNLLVLRYIFLLQQLCVLMFSLMRKERLYMTSNYFCSPWTHFVNY